jgi:hypothetical protein
MRWGQAILFFILGSFFGPWLMALVTGKGKSAASSAGY